MQASVFVGRLGVLAVALGIGVAAGLGIPAVASATPEDKSTPVDQSSPVEQSSPAQAGGNAVDAPASRSSVRQRAERSGSAPARGRNQAQAPSAAIADVPEPNTDGAGGGSSLRSDGRTPERGEDGGPPLLSSVPARAPISPQWKAPAAADVPEAARAVTVDETAVPSWGGNSAPTPPAALAAAAPVTVPVLVAAPQVSSSAPVMVSAPGRAAAAGSVQPGAPRAVVDSVLGSLAGTDPAAPVQSPVSWVMLAAARREIGVPAAATAAQAAALTTAQTRAPAPSAATPVAAPAAAVTNSPPVITSVTLGAPNTSTGAVTGTVRASDPNGDKMTYKATVASATKGKVSITTAGVFTYTPTATARHAAARIGATTAVKTDTVTVTVTDAKGAAVTRAVSVPISPRNTAPTAGKATVGTPNTTTGVITGRVSATDADRDPLSFTAPAATAKGTVAITAAGAFTYTPTAAARHAAARIGAPTAVKSDTFTVTVTDGYGGSLAVPVSVSISPRNTAPTATVSIAKPDPVTGIARGAVSATDADNDRLSYTAAKPGSGTVAVNTDGSFAYTPTAAARASARTAATARTDSFTITVTDGHGGSRAVSVTATIAPSNAAPVAGTPSASTNATTGVVTGTLNATDPDKDTLAYTAITTTTSKGSAVITSTGGYTYTPTATARHAAARTGATTAVKTDNFTATVTDKYGAATTIPVAVSIAPANAAPVAGTPTVGNPNTTTGVVTGTVTASDADRDSLTYSAPASTAKGAVAITAATGAFTYTPTAAARRAAAAPGATDADRTDSFSIDITDGHGGTASAAVTVSVSPADQPPASAEQLRPADLSFEGFFRVPTGQLAAGQYATLAYGGAALASRIVDGQRHFFLTGHRYANDPVVEIVSPATLGQTPGAAPVADVWRYWGDIYGGRKITAEESDPTRANANWTEGLLWDEAGQRLLWSYGNWYAALAVNNPVLGATEFDADGSSTAQGAWRTTAPSQQTRSFAVFLSPAVSAATGGATIGLGGKMQSINATASWGPSLYVIDSATGDSGTALTADALSSHPITPAGQRTPRSADYDVARNPDGSLDSAGTLPPVNGVGFWTELDETTGAVFAHNGSQTRSALIYTGGQASGVIWYGPDGEHGVADGRGYNGTGNHAENFRPMLWLVSEADLVAVAEGRLAPENLNPYAAVDLLEQFPELAFLNGLSAGQPVFAKDEGRLYVPFVGGDTEGGEPYPLIAVFSVAP